MSKKLEIIKQYYSSMESLDPGTQADIKFLIQQAEEKQKLEERVKEVENAALLTHNMQAERIRELEKKKLKYVVALNKIAYKDHTREEMINIADDVL